MSVTIRHVGSGLIAAVLFAASAAWAADSAGDFRYDVVIAKARDAAQRPYQEVSAEAVPGVLRGIGYDEWRDFRFKPDMALWKEERIGFQLQFFHPGFLYNRPVTINVVERGAARKVGFSREYFDYEKVKFRDKIPDNLEFAGFRIHYPINRRDYADEVAVFLGASYFRAVAQGQRYGLSARGLAINTAENDGEEFPFFKEFWVVKPARAAKELKVYALLDSPSIAGAYEFVIKPGVQTRMDVTAVLFARAKVRKLGIAPVSSMYFFGENRRRCDDFRPEVHDSDGVSMSFGSGEWIWRPLINPQRLFVNLFMTDGVRGFGMMQRDTDFRSYEDLEARYELRPSLWLEAKKGWGAGHVEVVQIPSPNEYNDNMVVYWVPERAVVPGESMAFSYALKWGPAQQNLPPGGYVVSTRHMTLPGSETVRFVVEFQGRELSLLPPSTQLEPEVAVADGFTLLARHCYKNEVSGAWRLVFDVRPDRNVIEKLLPEKRQAVELRAFLKLGPRVVTETWSYAVEL